MEFVRALAATSIDPRGHLLDATTMGIEGMQKSIVCSWGGGLKVKKGTLGDKERNLHRAVITPEANRASGGVIAATWVCEVQIHGVAPRL
jgi:hypothetical protein